MGAPGNPRSGAAQPGARGSDRRTGGDGRLDPVRWHRPGRGTLLRLAAVAALLVTAAAALWSHPQSCTAQAGGTPPPAGAAPPSDAGASPSPTGTPAGPAGAGSVPSGRVGVPIRLADPTALTLVHPGDHVDLLRTDDPAAGTTVAASALVLKVTGADDPATGGLLLALTRPEAERAVTATAHGFAVLIRPD
jgi:hypothetical protein